MFLVSVIIFFATFVQGTAGFGLALVSMPLLVSILGIRIAAPLVALVSVAAEVVLLIRYRQAFNLRAVSWLATASLFGIPFGIFILRRADEQIITFILGIIIVVYALYALISPRLPLLAQKAWAIGFGFASGLLSGAYNTGGPPVIIYGNCRQWPPAEFKSNLQGFFLLNSLVVLLIHFVSGSFTTPVWRNFAWGLPAILLGALAGFSLDRWINPVAFKRIVLILLIVLGGGLLLNF
jgi:uncharacterized membrane protein YfcA